MEPTNDSASRSERKPINLVNILVGIAIILVVMTIIGCVYAQYRANLFKDSFNFASTTTRLKNFYPKDLVNLRSDDEAREFIGTDGEFMIYCQREFPEAFCEDRQWSDWKELLASIAAEDSGWVIVESPEHSVSRDYLMTWNYDDRYGWHCYIVVPDWPNCDYIEKYYAEMSGWIYQDGVRVAACDAQTYSMKPLDVIACYQSGDWYHKGWGMGSGQLRSADFSTTVELKHDGSLLYRYSAEYYDKEHDPQGIAYDSYEDPWCEWTPVEAEYLITEEGSEHHSENELSDYAQTAYYPDLPIDYAEMLGNVYYSRRYNDDTEYGTYFLTKNGVIKASQGEIVDSWTFDTEITDDMHCYVLPVIASLESVYAAYVYTGEQIIGLKKFGDFDVIIDKVVDPPHSVADPVIGITDGSLIAWGSTSSVIIAENVNDALCEGPKLFAKENGCYAVVTERYGNIENGDFEIVFLGTESLEYYTQLYDVLDRSSLYD